MPPKPLPQPLSLAICLTVLTLVGGGTLLAAFLAGKTPGARPFQRALISFACLCGLSILAAILQAIFAPHNEQPFTAWLNLACLSLSSAISACLLYFAQGRKESAGLLILLGATVFTLLMSAWPLLPALPPLTNLLAAWATTGTAYVLPYRFARHRLTRRLEPGRPALFTMKKALLMTAFFATVATLAFTALAWHGLHPALLPRSFAWGGAGFGGITLLDIAVLYGYALYRRGGFQRWLRPEQETA
jgi:hypothetical protein